MANAVRVRVELRNEPMSRDEREREFRFLMIRFRKSVADAGILQESKRHETYESKSRKKRRKSKEAEIARLRSKLRENFVWRKKDYEQ